MNTPPSSSRRRLRARFFSAAALAALLVAAPEARAQLCWGTNCPPPRPAQGSAGGNAGGNAGAGAQGGTRGTVVWDPWTGKWIPQVVIQGQGQAGAGAQGQASGHAQGQLPQPPPPPPPPPASPPPPPPPPSWPAPPVPPPQVELAPPAPDYGGGLGTGYDFRPYLGVGGCLGVQFGFSDPVRFLTCARARLQLWQHVGFGLDLTYSFGADDYEDDYVKIAPEHRAYRHELLAFPYVSLHPVYQEFSPFLRVGPNLGVAPMLGDGWSETRSYLGVHGGFGFDIEAGKHANTTFDVVAFQVWRLDDSLRPDGRKGLGGWGVQMHLSVSYLFLL
ncbi:hypothetical protein [Sorangium sp. So ce1151]|uniref:hypothetical protein n=1 Tax=Sorangium sp. So ce1151 TaxID=3133332 RepID=UPI003F5EF48A